MSPERTRRVTAGDAIAAPLYSPPHSTVARAYNAHFLPEPMLRDPPHGDPMATSPWNPRDTCCVKIMLFTIHRHRDQPYTTSKEANRIKLQSCITLIHALWRMISARSPPHPSLHTGVSSYQYIHTDHEDSLAVKKLKGKSVERRRHVLRSRTKSLSLSFVDKIVFAETRTKQDDGR